MTITENESRINSEAFNGLEIAVIGLAGRFPGAKHIHEFWENLKNSLESISFFSGEELEESGLNPGLLKSPNYINAHGCLEGLEYFDSMFFGYSSVETDIMDPQMRVFHECAWSALEDAGYCPSEYQGLIGVYAGASHNINWIANIQLSGKADEFGGFAALPLTDKDYLSMRISYKLNLKGPAVIVQSACSTSLVSIHMACQAILNGECDMALAGGVTINTSKGGYFYQEGLILSPDGHCRSFDAKAKGTVPGNGAGIVVLKRLQNAITDGDYIYAVVKGSAINNDGIRKIGFTAPSIEGQAEAIITAQEMAEVEPESITYLETHGTGTDLGDPVEFEALKLAFNTDKKGYCAIGSVKSNVGHLDSAAGVVGFIKAVLALHYRLIPASLHFETPNPKIDFENSPFYVNTTLKEWKNHEYPLRAGVSSFGIGGTNAHVILEETPGFRGKRAENQGQDQARGGIAPPGQSQEYQLILLSAKTESALDKMTKNLIKYFKNSLLNHGNHENPINPGPTLADAAYTLQVGREAFKYRQMLVCQTVDEAIREFSSPGSGEVLSFVSKEKSPSVVFMFPGQGAQYVDMGWELYQHQPLFRDEMDRCFNILKPIMGHDIKEILYPGERKAQGAERKANKRHALRAVRNAIDQTEIAQPLIFAIEYALAKQLMKWGIQPDAMIGHSIGEYVAAHLAGVFTLEDALKIVVLRGKLMQHLPIGSMLSIAVPEEQLKPMLAQNLQLSLAAVNSPSNCTISGTGAAINEFEQMLKEKGYECRQLHTSHAFHSAMMDPILNPFQEAVSQIAVKEPEIPYISNLTGTWFTAGEAADQGYWAKHLRHTVRFSDGVKELQKKQPVIFLEIGPGKTLATFVKRHTSKDSDQMILNFLRHPRETVPDVYYLFKRIGQLWLYGEKILWQVFHEGEKRCRIPLPTYPFEGLRYQLEMEDATFIKTGKRKKKKPIPGEIVKSRLDQWFSIPSWKPSPIPGDKDQDPITHLKSKSRWLVLVNEGNWGVQLIKRLQQAHQEVMVVRRGQGFTHPGDGEYVINPSQDSDYQALFAELRSTRQMPHRIIHLWNVTENPLVIGEATQEEIDDALDLGFYSLLALAQAIGTQGLSDDVDDKDKVNIMVLTNRMQGVTGEEKLEPQKAVVRGGVSVIPAEYPAISCRSIDIDPRPGPDAPKEKEFIENLLADILSDAPDMYTAYRGNQRWVQAFTPVSLEKVSEEIPLLKEKGIYLITGGLGGIGLVLAEYLGRAYKARLVLVGRSVFPKREEWEEWLHSHDPADETSGKIRKILELETIGTEVLILQADAANLQQVQTAVARAEKQFGSMNGIIHAAGLPDGGMIQRRTRDMSEIVFSPKIKGTLVLDKIFNNSTRDKNLDFILLCSSISSLLAPAGQVAYCAANAFLDAFALASRQNHTTPSLTYTTAVNWDAWQEVGMAVKASLSAPPLQKLKATHPLFNTRDIYGPDHEEFVSNLSINQHWVLDEHRIMEIATLPGTAYLEMVRAAVETLHPNGTIELKDVYFLNPLTVRENRQKEVHTILKKMKEEKGYTFSVMTRKRNSTDQWVEHCRGKAHCPAEQEGKQKQFKIEELKARCPGQEKTYQLERRPYNFGSMSLGPRWDNLRHAKPGDHQAFGFLELPGTFADDLDAYKLHPALLDMANLLLERASEDKGAYVPFYYKKIKIKAPLPGKIFCYARSAGTGSSQQETHAYDITIINHQGKELVDIEEYTLKKVTTDQHTARHLHDRNFSGESNISLGISSPGSFDHLEFRPAPRRSPGPGEVEISVFATGLNFKEVLLALGALGTVDPEFTFGYECSGKITACGEGVESFKKGDEVIAFGSSCFSSYITTPVFLVAHKPANLSFEAAATIPMAFMTAYHALVKLGNLSEGERVLIHSAAGGVGMAAVQIARWKGAEIFATAGNEEKRSYLRSLGIQYVMNSRTLDFADEVMKHTDGKGVNVVLNSLSGEFIFKSISLLAPYGRFLEIGIRDILNDTPLGLRSFLKGLAYFNASLAADIPGIESVWEEVVRNFNDGTFTPLPHRTFAIEEVDRAFEYMSSGTHIGKIVVTRPDHLEELPQQQDTTQKNPLKHGILPAEGIEAFKRILANEEYPQVVVCTTDFFQRMKKTHGFSGAYLMEEMQKTSTSIPKQARPEISTPYTAPGTNTEKILAHIWQEFLGVREVGIHDDFFELGGDSLKVMTIISKIHKALDVEIPMNEFFSRPTITKLAEFIQATEEQAFTPIAPVEEKEYYPLSSAQKRLYILQQMETDFIGYNETEVFLVKGKIDKEKFNSTFIKLIKRHESLRTSFEMIDDGPVQRIHDRVEFKMEYHKVEKDEGTRGLAPLPLDSTARSPQPAASTIKSFVRPFDLTHAPLLQVGLMEVGKEEYLLIFDMHHIITDANSMKIIIKDFLSLYTGDELQTLQTRYKDFSQWQNSVLLNEKGKSSEDYWISQFTGEIPVLDLPTDYPRPLMQSFEGHSIAFDLGEENTKALRELALEKNATLFMVILAVYSILLSKISGSEDIVVGVPIAGRSHVDLELIIGMFVNTLALRNYPTREKTFANLLQEIKKQTLDAFENQEYQIEELVGKVTAKINRDTSRNALFDTVFVLRNIVVKFSDPHAAEETGLKMTRLDYENKPAKFDLALNGDETDENLFMELVYCTKLFKKETIQRWIQYFKKIIALVLEKPGTKISGMEIIPGEEKKRLLVDFNRTRKDYPHDKTIHQLFQEQAAKTPNQIALQGPILQNTKYRITITYKQLNEKSHQLARHLRQKGVESNVFVGIMLRRSIEMIVGLFGILKAGGAYLPLDPQYPEERINYILHDSGAKFLLAVTGTQVMDKTGVENKFIKIINISDLLSSSTITSTLTGHVSPANLAYVIYTSGSTGKPKGIVIRHQNAVNFIKGMTSIIDFFPGKTILALTTISFDIFFLETLLALTCGMKVVMANEEQQRDPDLLQKVIAKNNVNMLQLTPSRLQLLLGLQENLWCLAGIRELIVGGEAFPTYLFKETKTRFQGKIYNVYGPTETTIWSTVKDLTQCIPEELNIGKPIANTYIYIVDRHMQVQPLGVAGELLIGGDGVAAGYLNKPALSAEKFTEIKVKVEEGEKPVKRSYMSNMAHMSYIYKTGDLARWLPDGNVEFLGRMDFQVKIRGYRIELSEIEDRLSSHEEIDEAIVISKEDKTGDKHLCAYCVSHREIPVPGLRVYLSKILPEYMIPAYFVQIDKIPLTPNGKVNRTALPEPEVKVDSEYVPPRNKIEEKLVEIWSEVLNKGIGIDDDFFEMGGHSLRATIVAAKIHKTFSIKIPLGEIFKVKTIRGMSTYIKGANKDEYTTIFPEEEREYFTLSSTQKRLYMIQQMETDAVFYNMPNVVLLEGDLDREKLEEVFRKLINRHESFRTSFAVVKEEVVQKIHHEVGFEIEYINAEPGPQNPARNHIKKFIRPFDLSQAPLLRVGLIKTTGNEHILMVDIHHMISDGTSAGILIKEFMALYGEEELPALPTRYKDYSQWQSRHFSWESESYKNQEAYWLKEFQGGIPGLNLPADFPRPDILGFAGGSLFFTIGSEDTTRLKKIATREKISLFVMMISIINVFISKMTGQEDITMGTQVAGRRHTDLENIIGVFINTLVIRNYPRKEKTFKELLKETGKRTLKALENQEYSFEDLVEKLLGKRELNRNPLFDVMFVWQNMEIENIQIPGLTLKPYNEELKPTALIDLSLYGHDNGHEIIFMLEYNTALFKQETIERFINYLREIIAIVATDKEIKLKDIKISHDLGIAKSGAFQEEDQEFGF